VLVLQGQYVSEREEPGHDYWKLDQGRPCLYAPDVVFRPEDGELPLGLFHGFARIYLDY